MSHHSAPEPHHILEHKLVVLKAEIDMLMFVAETASPDDFRQLQANIAAMLGEIADKLYDCEHALASLNSG
ncbi:hypothetical protein [Martelella mediterranea]|uniref:Uncharacterized protein n=1 Tax=Martelella mediterranea TaxID=293089 RepID=A0A4R3NKF5_9HYPH|nr:hypothetical protein [Martelella mediterranea]TCT34657.1 hypothetical protein EDC90_103351 [Martelella mediterranea]